ncbi:MAG: TonB-dependent receptor plug domain-containing protein [Acidobacteriota bacterium]
MSCVRRSRSYWYDKSIFGWLPVLVAILTLVAAPVSLLAAPQDEEGSESSTEEETAKDEKEDISFFGEQTVTATGVEVETFDIPAPVIVIEAQRIEELQPNNASELLRNEPGVDVNGVGPNQARPIIRGNRGLRVLFLEDGLRSSRGWRSFVAPDRCSTAPTPSAACSI